MNSNLNQIHPDAKISSGVVVDSFTTIYEDVEIGENTWIGPNVTIMNGARIGANCKIFPGAVISAIPQDLKFKGESTQVVIGDNTVIRECVTINRGTSATGKTQIGSNCLIMAYSHIAHDCMVGNYCIFSNNSTLAGHITIGNHVVLAWLTAIQQFCNIGDFAFISGGSLVRKDIPPFIKVARDPLIFVGVNAIGMERNGVEKERIETIQQIYRILFKSNYNISQALEIIKAKKNSIRERDDIIAFIEKSKQGIVRGYQQKN
jgi:UDP-N-acetylglucosamine acyltransferase